MSCAETTRFFPLPCNQDSFALGLTCSARSDAGTIDRLTLANLRQARNARYNMAECWQWSTIIFRSLSHRGQAGRLLVGVRLTDATVVMIMTQQIHVILLRRDPAQEVDTRGLRLLR